LYTNTKLNQWQVSIPINGLHDVLKEANSELSVEGIKFHLRDTERVGVITIKSDSKDEAVKEARYLINKSLARICFAYNTEASASESGEYVSDLSHDPNKELVCSSLTMRWSHIKEDPAITLTKIASISTERDTLDLALAYYKLGEYSNPLRIEAFFSCITVLTRSLLSKDKVETSDLKKHVRDVLKQRDSKFNESTFEIDWQNSYPEERCAIAHGRGSKLIDPRTSIEHNRLVNTVAFWTREVIYHYIDRFKT
jgi:hypothetical protein